MAAHTLTQVEPRLTLLLATVATDDTIVNNTGAMLELVTAADVTVGDVTTMTKTADIAMVKPGATYTVLVGNDGDAVYAVALEDNILSTVPGITVTTV